MGLGVGLGGGGAVGTLHLRVERCTVPLIRAVELAHARALRALERLPLALLLVDLVLQGLVRVRVRVGVRVGVRARVRVRVGAGAGLGPGARLGLGWGWG